MVNRVVIVVENEAPNAYAMRWHMKAASMESLT